MCTPLCQQQYLLSNLRVPSGYEAADTLLPINTPEKP